MTNKIQDAFDNVKADTQLKETTKQFISAAHNRKSGFTHRQIIQKTAATVCLLLIILSGIAGYRWIQAPVSYVSIDINPSIELALNRFDRVLSATAYNTEGEEILKNLSLYWKKYTDAMDMIVKSKDMANYLTDDSELVFTIAADSDRNSKLTTTAEYFCRDIGQSCQSYSTDIKTVSEAHNNGLCLGKYYAYLQLLQYDDTVTVDDCRDMSTARIHCLTREHEENENHEQNENHNQHENYRQEEESTLSNEGMTDTNGTSSGHDGSHHEKRNHK